ncbi:putative Coiled-coil domain-containing protein 51 [Hypsibius exemplaris]|uniref:Coiled-coil domain-containing protein 51 n=1 Tax=Hypsibius exemplaris TaxID=2072580 RepID=A0A1W0XAM5_HYPEX|nr:putative Coiled-coil domain-containing protein 51 [Hypsibius exemplaris]
MQLFGSSSTSPASLSASNWYNQKITSWIQQYEDFLGLTEVKEAQSSVMEAEKSFIQSQQVRRERNRKVSDVQQKLQDIRAELERTARGEDRYLALVTQEHKLVKEERTFQQAANDSETAERGAFSLLSAAVRESHEKERARAERTKYWSVIGSVIGAMIGIVGTSLNNHLRMKELQSLVTRSVATNAAPVENLTVELGSLAKAQQHQLETFVGDLKTLLGEQSSSGLTASFKQYDEADSSSKEVLSAVKEHQLYLTKEMQAIKDFIAAKKGIDASSGDAIVYVKEDLERALGRTEQNMEWKMKINSIVTAAFMYTAFALTVPLIYYLYGQK